MFLSCRPFVVITKFSTGLVRVEVTSVSWIRAVEQKHTHILDVDETTVENKGKVII